MMTDIVENFNKDTRIWQLKAERDALASMLKDVQKECIELRQENERLREALRYIDSKIFVNGQGYFDLYADFDYTKLSAELKDENDENMACS